MTDYEYTECKRQFIQNQIYWAVSLGMTEDDATEYANIMWNCAYKNCVNRFY
jgi:hypothetical protein